MKHKIHVAKLQEVKTENPALVKNQKAGFFHQGKQIDAADLESVSNLTLDFIRSIKPNGRPFVDIEQYQHKQKTQEEQPDLQKQDEEDPGNLKEQAKLYYTQPINFLKRLDEAFPTWTGKIVKGHTQTALGLVSSVAMRGIREKTEGSPAILIQPPEFGDLSADLIPDNDRLLLKVTLNKLPIKSVDSNEVIGYLPGPAEATYELTEEKGTWGYKLVGEVETENDHLYRMLQGELIPEQEIEIAYCHPYLLSKEAENYRDAIAQKFNTNREDIMSKLNEVVTAIYTGNETEFTKRISKEDLGVIFNFKEQFFAKIKDYKTQNLPHAGVKALSDLLLELNQNNRETLKILRKYNLFNEKSIQELMKFGMANALSKPLEKNTFDIVFNQLKTLSNSSEDKNFIAQVEKIQKKYEAPKKSIWSALWHKEDNNNPKVQPPPQDNISKKQLH